VLLDRQILKALAQSAAQPVCSGGQIVKNVMRDAAFRIFVFSQLRKHETMTLTFHKRKYRKSPGLTPGAGKDFRVIHRFLKRPAQEPDAIRRCVRRT
jgi:hypothetical protein